MPVPQVIVTLSPSGDLIAELPGINGSRRKVDLISPNSFVEILSNTILTLQAIRDKQDLDIEASKAAKEAEKSYNEKTVRKARIARDAANMASLRLTTLNENISKLETILAKDETTIGVLYKILNAQLVSQSKLGEDGAPTNQQVKHWEKHGTQDEYISGRYFSDPSCPFCKSEGRFEKGKNREISLKGLSFQEALKLGLISRGFNPSKNNPDLFLKGKVLLKLETSKILDFKTKIYFSKAQITNLIEDGKSYAKVHGFQPQEAKPKKLGSGVTVKKLVRKLPASKPSKLKNLSF